jgi:hypothetical protein
MASFLTVLHAVDYNKRSRTRDGGSREKSIEDLQNADQS